MVQEGALTALASVADSSQVLTCFSFSDSIYLDFHFGLQLLID